MTGAPVPTDSFLPHPLVRRRSVWRVFASWIAAASLIAIAVLTPATIVQRGTIITRTVERDRAIADVADFRRVATEAAVSADRRSANVLLSTAAAKAALAAIARDRQEARRALARVDRDTKATRSRAVANDVELTRTQASNTKTFARATPVIAALKRVRPTGNASTDTALLDDAVEQPWKGWR